MKYGILYHFNNQVSLIKCLNNFSFMAFVVDIVLHTMF